MTTPYAYMKLHLRALNRIQFERASYSRPVCPELDIIYEAPPVPVTERVAATFACTNSQITMLQKRVLTQKLPDEHPNAKFQSTACAISALPIQRLINQAPDEHLNSDFAYQGVGINMIQSGVTPI